MIVASNTSLLTNLAAIGQFDLLRRLCDQVHITQGVWEELNARGEHWPGSDQVAQADWIQRMAHFRRCRLAEKGILIPAPICGMIGR